MRRRGVAALGRVQARFRVGRRPGDRRRLRRFAHGIGGQAYGLFFALVANDRRTFDTILAWTENNLAQGDLSAHLPAWLGRAPDGAWRVLDANAASDADLWIAYTLVEAGRWHERSYPRAALLAKRVLDTETASVPGLGLTLLPGPTGFKLANGQWRVNPSYSPPQVIRGGLPPACPTSAAGPR
jgi:endoglucanase